MHLEGIFIKDISPENVKGDSKVLLGQGPADKITYSNGGKSDAFSNALRQF